MKSSKPVAWMVCTEVVAQGAQHRSTHLVYARSERAAVSEAREREAQAWNGYHVVGIVYSMQA